MDVHSVPRMVQELRAVTVVACSRLCKQQFRLEQHCLLLKAYTELWRIEIRKA